MTLHNPIVDIVADLREMQVKVDALLDQVGDSFLRVVHRLVTDIEYLVVHRVEVFKCEQQTACHVADVNEGAAKPGFVQDQLLVLQGLKNEIIDPQVKSQPRRR